MNYLPEFIYFTELNRDIVVSVLNQSEMQTVVSFAETNKSNRELASKLINHQFNQLLKYTNENCKTYDNRSIEKHIRDKWVNIQARMMSSDLKDCINFKVFKEAFDVLKLFSHEIHFKKDEVSNLNCPIFITEMLSTDSDQGIWDAMIEDKTNPFQNKNLKVNSIAKELKKIGLLTESESIKPSFKLLPQHTVSSFSLSNSNNLKTISFTIFQQNLSSNVICSINETSDKWDNINTIYNNHLIEFNFRGKKINSIPLNDYRTETQLYSYAEEQIKKFPGKDYQNLNNGDFWLRYSDTQKDSFGKPKIVLCIKKSDRVIKCLIPIENFISTKEFDDFIQANIK